MEEYVIVSFISIPKQAYFKRSNWPLHLTIIGNFYTKLESDELIKLLTETANKINGLIIPTKTKALFGSKHNLPVTELLRTQDLQTLHVAILKILLPFIKLKTPIFNGDGYRPHVTDKTNGSLAVGDKFFLKSVSIVRLEDENANVLKTIQLQLITAE